MAQQPILNDELARFSVTMPQGLLGDLDTMVRVKGYANRSAALGEIVRDALVEHHQEKYVGDREIVGTITLVYDHHKPNVQSIITELQHDYAATIISTLHVHLDHHYCLEVLMVRGNASQVHILSDALTTVKGVRHGKLTVTTTDKDLPNRTVLNGELYEQSQSSEE